MSCINRQILFYLKKILFSKEISQNKSQIYLNQTNLQVEKQLQKINKNYKNYNKDKFKKIRFKEIFNKTMSKSNKNNNL